MSEQIQIRTSDGEEFTVDVDIIRCSVTINSMIEQLGLNEGEEAVPLANVSGRIFCKVLEWATHHKVRMNCQKEAVLRLYDAYL